MTTTSKLKNDARWRPGWVPVMEENGNKVVIDMDSGPEGKVGQVFRWYNSGGLPMTFVAETWAGWLDFLAEELSARRFSVRGEYCFVRAGDIELLLSTGAHLGGAPSFTGTLYFRVAGVVELYDAVSERAEVVWPLEDQEYGTREFGVRDPDGYVLAFAEARDAQG